jgi:hypothetical protein
MQSWLLGLIKPAGLNLGKQIKSMLGKAALQTSTGVLCLSLFLFGVGLCVSSAQPLGLIHGFVSHLT